MSGHELMFASQREEANEEPMQVEGEIPDWLEGALLRTGPGVFDSPSLVAEHWFMGLAMMSRIDVSGGEARFSSQLLRSRSFEKAQQPPLWPPLLDAAWKRIRPFLPNNPRSDNAGVNVVAPYGAGETVAMTETLNRVQLDPDRLAGKPYVYEDDVVAHLTTAHPVRDDARGAWFNYGTQFGKDATYHLWRVDDGARTRRVIASLQSRRPAYMHSIGATRDHLLLTEFPLFVQAIRLKFGHKTLFDYMAWDESSPMRVRAVHKDTGDVAGEWNTDPEFAFHHLNAREVDGGFEMDLVGFGDAKILWELNLDKLRSDSPPDGMGRLRRYTLKTDGSWEKRDLADVGMELPRCDWRRAGDDVRWVYAVSNSGAGRFTDQLVRVDTTSGDTKVWKDDALLPGEPVFVPRPGGDGEQDGTILSLALDPEKKRSALVVLDPETFEESARAWAPTWVPQGFHGDFHFRG